MGRTNALKSNERAKENRRIKHEYNQDVGRSIRATEAEWEAERESGVDRPLPAAFGSYSNWAGPKQVAADVDESALQPYREGGSDHSYRAVGSAGRMQFKPAAASGLSLEEHCDQQGDPGAYTPYEHSELAATAAFTFNTRSQEQAAARAEQAQPTGGGSSSSSSSTELAVPAPEAPWWVFKFNRVPLRDEASSGELRLEAARTGAAGSAAGQLLGAKLEQLFLQDASASASASASAAPGSVDVSDAFAGATAGDGAVGSAEVSAMPPGTVPTVGSFLGATALNARGRKEQREKSEAAEKEARWKAKHHRGSHVPPPLPNRMRKRRPAGSRNYYAILKLQPSANAEEIKHAYRKLAKEWHPDRVYSGASSNKDPDKARRMFVLIARAFEVLGDQRTRDAYDAGEDVDAKAKLSAK